MKFGNRQKNALLSETKSPVLSSTCNIFPEVGMSILTLSKIGGATSFAFHGRPPGVASSAELTG
jgi:hypothetical protein